MEVAEADGKENVGGDRIGGRCLKKGVQIHCGEKNELNKNRLKTYISMPPATRRRHKDDPQRDIRDAVGFLLIEANKHVRRLFQSAQCVPLPARCRLIDRQQQ